MSPSGNRVNHFDIAASAVGSAADNSPKLTQPAADAVSAAAGPLTPDATPALKRRNVQPRLSSGVCLADRVWRASKKSALVQPLAELSLRLSYAGDGVGSSATWDGHRLYWFDEAPPPLQYNQFVRSGYRAGLLS